MPYSYNDRVRDTTTYTGSAGTVTLAGSPPAGFRSFSVASNNNTFVAVVQQDLSQWEVMEVSVNSTGTTLTRTNTVSSSTGSAVNFTAGTKDVFITMPGSRMVAKKNSGSGPLVIGTTAEDTTSFPDPEQTIALGNSTGGCLSLFSAANNRIGFFIGSATRVTVASNAAIPLRLSTNNIIRVTVDRAGPVYSAGSVMTALGPTITHTASATMTAANLVAGSIQRMSAGATANITLTTPSAASMETALVDAATQDIRDIALDFYVVNENATFTATVADANVIVGNAVVTPGTSGHFRFRRATSVTYFCYRVS